MGNGNCYQPSSESLNVANFRRNEQITKNKFFKRGSKENPFKILIAGYPEVGKLTFIDTILPDSKREGYKIQKQDICFKLDFEEIYVLFDIDDLENSFSEITYMFHDGFVNF